MATGHATVHEALADARKTLDTTGTSKRSKIEKSLDGFGGAYDKISDPSSSQVTGDLSDVAKKAWQTIQPRLSDWERHYEIVQKALNVIKDLHPAIGVAVVVFNAAIQFEVTRRQNDQKIAILRVTMIETMEELTCLEKALSADPNTIRDLITEHLEYIIEGITAAIKRCATECDIFQNRHVFVRAAKSFSWAQKLKDFVDTFDGLKQKLHDAMQLVITRGVQQTAFQVSSLNTKVDNLLELFQNLRTPAEQQAYAQWTALPKEQQTGSAKDDKLDELVKRFASCDAPSDQAKNAQKTAFRVDVVGDIKRDLKSSLDEMLREQNAASSAKFDALVDKLRIEIGDIVKRDGDRVIDRLLAGPHDSIKDPGVWKVWTEMGWRRCTESRPLVKALREYYAEIYESLREGNESAGLVPVAVHDKRRGSSDSGTSHDQEAEPEKTARVFSLEDGWTLKYISMLRVHPLLEMLDQDYSSWVTVNEINHFTSARPKDWSVPHWMTYWTLGQALSTAHYYARIHQVMWKIHQAWKLVLPSNNAFVDVFMGMYAAVYTSLNQILAGAYDIAREVSEEFTRFDQFEDYIFEKERKLKSFLEKIRYYLDAPNTMALLLGSDRLEQHLLPILYLMASRYLEIIKLGAKVQLHEGELTDMINSHNQLFAAVDQRIETIKKDICLVNDLPFKDTIKKFASGLYIYYSDDFSDYKQSEYFAQFYIGDRLPPIISGVGSDSGDGEAAEAETEVSVDPETLRYKPIGALDFHCYDIAPVEAQQAVHSLLEPTGPAETCMESPRSVLYHGTAWYGRHRINRIEVTMPLQDGDFDGYGFYVGGEFGVRGRREGSRFVFRTVVAQCSDAAPASQPDPESEAIPSRSFFDGTINDEGDSITGFCTHGRSSEDVWTPLQEDERHCSFSLSLHHPEFFSIFRPQGDADDKKAQALWRYARDAVLHVVRAAAGRLPRWEYFSARRERRRRYLNLYTRSMDREWLGSWWGFSELTELTDDEEVELRQLELSFSVADIRFYRSLAYLLMRSQTVHNYVCDNCTTYPLRRTRIICLDCLKWIFANKGPHFSFDLCTNCAREEFKNPKYGVLHDTTHRLVQTRRPQFEGERSMKHCNSRQLPLMLWEDWPRESPTVMMRARAARMIQSRKGEAGRRTRRTSVSRGAMTATTRSLIMWTPAVLSRKILLAIWTRLHSKSPSRQRRSIAVTALSSTQVETKNQMTKQTNVFALGVRRSFKHRTGTASTVQVTRTYAMTAICGTTRSARP
ncbi:hypothetical protein PsYK624_135630 [Phanerochaete sordida]|uniref:Vacuolar protein sorting-associated protein 13 second N-terminal domain-containing protein n=1 Tax=Phanerochaete sordida TaxID=48140 RepID=A0A9P3LKK7_9APHY|nr:hypothetical protein PsYK624_135630 [Phanerochaete sordida]